MTDDLDLAMEGGWVLYSRRRRAWLSPCRRPIGTRVMWNAVIRTSLDSIEELLESKSGPWDSTLNSDDKWTPEQTCIGSDGGLGVIRSFK